MIYLFDIYNEQGTWTSNTRRQASGRSCCILVVLASWFVLFLSIYLSFVSALFLSFVFSFVNASFLCLCFLFFDGLGLKDSPSSNMLRFFQNIPRCSSFFGCCSSLGFGNEVNSQFLTAIATNIVQISQITNKLAFSTTIDLLTNGGQRHLSEVDI